MPRLPLSALAVSAALLTAPAAQAQQNPYLGAAAIRQYTLSQVSAAPGLVDVPYGDVVTFKFPSRLVSNVLAQQQTFRIEMDEDVAYVSALATTGSSTVIFKTEDGVLERFVLRAVAVASRAKGVEIVDDRTAGSAVSKGTPVPQPVSAIPKGPAPISSTPPAPISSTPPAPITAQVPVTSPASARSALDDALQRLQAYSQAPLQGTLAVVGNRLQLTIQNAGTTAQTLKGADLRLYVDGQPVAVSADGVTVPAQGQMTVTLRPEAAISEEQRLQVAWIASDGVSVSLLEVRQ
ncbi:hypothetical protein [Deinococcus sonorensis]|uniref:Uncharacterized protein n=1 Tax=Deinococcus sonorensis TaxID=309891 RepID=A0ABV8YCA6_9DEIO